VVAEWSLLLGLPAAELPGDSVVAEFVLSLDLFQGIKELSL